jgi:hypothetical protein
MVRTSHDRCDFGRSPRSPPFTAFAQQGRFGNADEAKAMLAKAVAAVKADKAKALDMFNKGERRILGPRHVSVLLQLTQRRKIQKVKSLKSPTCFQSRSPTRRRVRM